MSKPILSQLPSFNSDNFAKYSGGGGQRSTGRPSVYLPTCDQKDDPHEQVIKNDHTNILLRFLHQNWNQKDRSGKRRDAHSESEPGSSKKKPRVSNSNSN